MSGPKRQRQRRRAQSTAEKKVRKQQDSKERRKQRRAQHKALRERELTAGLARATNPAMPNRKSPHETPEEERAEREQVTVNFFDVIKSQLPAILAALAKIKDFRNPKKIEHQLAIVLFYGILCFVLQISSRREANRELTGPILLAHLQIFFPELKELPHQDTVNRILTGIDVEELQEAHLEKIKRLIRNKKFARFLVDGRYPIAFDGTQKMVRREQVSEEWLRRRVNKGKETERTQYYVYVLEACLAFPNGLTLPLLSEFLNHAEGDISNNKQDCETKAFRRLAARVKKTFPHLPILVLLDGLYPNGPIMEVCKKSHWQFMIVLKDGSLPSVWEDYQGLRKAEPNKQMTMTWGNRHQHFQWANDISYRYGSNQKRHLNLHLVVCTEKWEEIDPKTGESITRTSRHAWLSSEPLNKGNLHKRCNLGARHRWGIEENILVEKCQGYHYEHCFSHNWNAMKGYHYLMHLGHALNVLAQHSESLIQTVTEKGVRGFIKFVMTSLVHPWLDPETLKDKIKAQPQLRLA